jgi:redox-sensitive bicupin YhaK (pirin superfamily)
LTGLIAGAIPLARQERSVHRLMDDRLDMGVSRVGGPDPHAGFETVTLVLDGEICRVTR